MSELENEIERITNSLKSLCEKMKEAFHLPPYHYIELFIYFNNFIEEEDSISKESFISANSSLAQADNEDEEYFDAISEDIYNKLTDSNSIYLFELYAFLKGISTNYELNDNILFKILDKDDKGYIDYSDVEVLISSFEDFINEKYDWTDFQESFEGKKITKRNLGQGEFDVSLINLFNAAEKIINKKIEKSYHLFKNLEKKNVDADNENENENEDEEENNDNDNEAISEKNNEKKNDSDNRNSETNNNSIQNSDKKKDLNQINQIAIYNKSYDNINYENIDFESSENINMTIEDIIFDKRKENLVNQIKLTSFLYDLTLKEFISEFVKYKNEIFDKMKFINTILDIIKKKTSNLFKNSVQKLALSMLFQIIDINHNNKISYYEVMGAFLFLTKATNEERLLEFFNYSKNELTEIICGALSLYLNSHIIKDYNILSSIFVDLCADKRMKNPYELISWIFQEDKNDEKNNNYQDSFLNDELNESSIQNYSESKSEALKALNEKFLEAKKIFSNELEEFSIIDVTQELLNHSLLGQINNFQLSSLLEVLLNWKFGDVKSKERIKVKNDFISFIEKYFDFSQNELIDITNLHSLFLLMFTGTTIEKIRSIFNIYEINENDLFDVDDFIDYLSNLFNFLLKEMNINGDISSKSLAEIFVKNVNKGKNKISLIDLVQSFEYIVLE